MESLARRVSQLAWQYPADLFGRRALTAKYCSVFLTDVKGGGLGEARDYKSGVAINGFAEWNKAFADCNSHGFTVAANGGGQRPSRQRSHRLRERSFDMKHIVLAIALAASFTSAASAAPLTDLSGGQTGRIEFISITPLSMWSYARRNMTGTKQVVVYGDLLMPKNTTGKVPALVLSHGSSGVSPYAYEVWARQMNAAGVAVL